MHDEAVVEHTRRWVASFVIGLGLCPFARQVFDAGRIRYAVTHARNETALLNDLTSELHFLCASPCAQTETTLLIHPYALIDFGEYNDFLSVVDQRLKELHLCGIIQVASFHPHYQFACTSVDAVDNYTNRSPYPMLHLLREASVSRAADAYDELEEIPRRNIERLRSLGRAHIVSRLQSLDAE